MLDLEKHIFRHAALGVDVIDLRVIHEHCEVSTRYQVWAVRALHAFRHSANGRYFVTKEKPEVLKSRHSYFITLPLAEMIYAREFLRTRISNTQRHEIKFLTTLTAILEGIGSIFPGELVLQHKVGNYVLDAFVARRTLCIEYDEKYHDMALVKVADSMREDDIRLALPGARFIRVKQGKEGEGIAEIIRFLGCKTDFQIQDQEKKKFKKKT